MSCRAEPKGDAIPCYYGCACNMYFSQKTNILNEGDPIMSAGTKSLQIEKKVDGKIVLVKIVGKLTVDDYHLFVPELERMIKSHGKVRIFLELHDFHGWTAGALWEDAKFDFKHFNDIERLAIVGEKQWEKGMAIFCKPFTTAKVRFFEAGEAEAAMKWIEA